MARNLSLLSFAVVALLTLGIALTATPDAVEAGQCLPCSLGSPTTTPVVTVTDVDCQWSEMKARNQLESLTSCPSGYCSKQFITTEACHKVGYQQWRVGMKLTFQCKECIESPSF
jgi:hypothetical protein